MSDVVLVALITGGFTLGGVVLTSIFAQRQASKITDVTLREARRREVRALLVELTRAGRRWVAIQQIHLISLHSSGANWDSFLSEFADTDSGRNLASDNATIPAVGGELVLMVSDGTLNAAVSDLLVMIDGYAEEVVAAILKAAKVANGKGDFQATLDGLAYVRRVELLFETIKARSAELLRVDL
ncbi:MAG: hypothetical protein JWO18_2908 [Microbacteriaceae bacterium]|nr:hypothetical protein [Microbacteriaceae bacterium]